MRYKGRMADRVGLENHNFISPVTEAIITSTMMQIDWTEDSERGHLRATSSDGITYVGTFGYPQLNPELSITLKRYDAKDGSILLVGSWNDQHEEATCVFSLSLAAKSSSTSK